ncbi:unnamed protein product, partial [Prorocentrum cordatum]
LSFPPGGARETPFLRHGALAAGGRRRGAAERGGRAAPGQRVAGEPSPPADVRLHDAGCCKDNAMITVDANWRWLHGVGGYDNCYAGGWVKSHCPNPGVCAQKCVLEGLDPATYQKNYGITTNGNAVRLQFLAKNDYGLNVGSRVYAMQGNAYKMFFLKNREFTFDVDLATLGCGINGALYFVEMQEKGDLGVGQNKAGAHYGTGYCDAQCFLDGKFIGGTANVPMGSIGYCCTEVDIWEANMRSTAFSMHTCADPGAVKCSGLECGPGQHGDATRSQGKCDRDGCDWNDWRLGNKAFFGPGAGFQIDTTKAMTITTQFLTSDGTDEGDLVEIRRSYKQDGKTIEMPSPSLVDESASSMTDDFCKAQKTAFGDPADFQDRGGMKALGDALDRGMVLVMSIWDDTSVYMDWLDSTYPKGSTNVGAERGNCTPGVSTPENVRKSNPHAYVTYSNIRVGKIGTTKEAVGDVCARAPINVYKPSAATLSAPTQYSGPPTTPVPSTQPSASTTAAGALTTEEPVGDLFASVARSIDCSAPDCSEPTRLYSKLDAGAAALDRAAALGGLSTTVLCAAVASALLAVVGARWYRAPPSPGTARLIAADPSSGDASDSP